MVRSLVMRGYFGIGALVVSAIGLSACAERSVAADSTEADAPPPCEAPIDAIAFRCDDGRTFSVRHDLNSACVVVFLEHDAHMLPHDSARDVFTNGEVTFQQSRATATLTGVGEAPFEGCTLVEP